MKRYPVVIFLVNIADSPPPVIPYFLAARKYVRYVGVYPAAASAGWQHPVNNNADSRLKFPFEASVGQTCPRGRSMQPETTFTQPRRERENRGFRDETKLSAASRGQPNALLPIRELPDKRSSGIQLIPPLRHIPRYSSGE